MAVLTGITNAVRSAAAGAAQRTVSSAISGVKSISGLNAEGSNSQLGYDSSMDASAGGSSNTILSFPENVHSDPQQGHYVKFFINTRSNGKLITGDSRKNMKSAVDKIKRENNITLKSQFNAAVQAAGGEFGGMTTIQSQAVDGPKIPEGNITGAKGARNRSLTLSKLQTTRLEQTIALYMPPSVQVNYEIKYADNKIGNVAIAGSEIIDRIRAGGSTTSILNDIIDGGAGTAVGEAVTNFFNAGLDTLAPGARTLVELERGSVITPRMEMMFEGVGRRQFSFSFIFVPKSRQEALTVEQIIKKFKFYSMPAYSNPETRREMEIPGTFDIRYMYQGQENNFINRISTCFLTKVDVQYGGDRYTAYENIPGRGTPPQRSSLTLNFTELETLSQQHIEDGY
jgi:hypothetical protein